MRRMLLAALLVALFAVVLAPSATTKKTPPPAPSGTFTLNPGSAITLTNMTLSSQDQVQAAVCVTRGTSGSGFDCDTYQSLGDNASVDPGAVVQLDDWAYTNQYVFPVQVVIGLGDYTEGTAYISDGTYSEMDGNYQPGSHATVGWVKGAMVLSMNDGSQYPFAEWKPVLGAGNFNTTVQVASTLPTSPNVTITNIAGYSDGPALDESNNPVCSFHTEFTYTAGKAKTVQGAVAAAGIWQGTFGSAIGSSVPATLGASPFNAGTFSTSTNLATGGDYVFVAMIESSNKDLLALGLSSTFTLDPTTYVDGCPAVGQLVSSSLE